MGRSDLQQLRLQLLVQSQQLRGTPVLELPLVRIRCGGGNVEGRVTRSSRVGQKKFEQRRKCSVVGYHNTT